ncbi:hypothetical protein D3C83_252760 [compost metagenome]
MQYLIDYGSLPGLPADGVTDSTGGSMTGLTSNSGSEKGLFRTSAITFSIPSRLPL